MIAASHMELEMVLDSRRGRLFSLGLRLGFAGGCRLRYWLLLPKRQVAPGTQSSWIVLFRWWSGSCVRQCHSYGERREDTVRTLCHEQWAPVGSSYCHILHGHCRTEIVSLRIPWSQLGPEMIGRLKCMSLTSHLEGPKRRCIVCSHGWIGYSSDGQWRWVSRMVHIRPNVWFQMAL